MGDLIDFMAYKKKREALPKYNSELDRLSRTQKTKVYTRFSKSRQRACDVKDSHFINLTRLSSFF